MKYIDYPGGDKKTIVATAGTDNIRINIPSDIPEKQKIKDLAISVYNTSGARGRIVVLMYDTTGTYTQVLLAESQTDSNLPLIATYNGAIPGQAPIYLQAVFYNCVANDSLLFAANYTLRRYH